ncbi:uncharacterized protein DUF1992 [Krasilnikovia cinnamomea]|uniref:Uncharacterized protein DUF1992 n=1 Tax=Krasilnikovia cinnamomea TaxID=349313 RepID=A0A4Q7ZTQ8_9ACTN|nr:DUF1992 domain-containing protein [Krasilnikovia cinnamomea]RZU54627.1 uncharacterized protein DUF1992 [Krasilnikovia cinnamomea]
MAQWYESAVDRRIREAQEQGEFDNLPGTGKPLADHGREYDEDWWIKDWLEREGAASAALPPTLALRREVEDLPAAVDRLRSEQAVRALVAEVNERIRQARVGLLDGPAVVLPPRDPDEVVGGWRARRSA